MCMCVCEREKERKRERERERERVLYGSCEFVSFLVILAHEWMDVALVFYPDPTHSALFFFPFLCDSLRQLVIAPGRVCCLLLLCSQIISRQSYSDTYSGSRATSTVSSILYYHNDNPVNDVNNKNISNYNEIIFSHKFTTSKTGQRKNFYIWWREWIAGAVTLYAIHVYPSGCITCKRVLNEVQ
jgi:hypothetical protein